jgi:hypothetical protein
MAITDRKIEAVARQEAWAKLSTAEKIASLDRRLGKGVGAVKQRAKLSVVKTASVQAALTPEPMKATVEDEAPAPKKLKAKERRAKATESS